MPETLSAREKIQDYLKANDITLSDLAVMYGMAKQDLTDYLSGRKSTPKGNKLIIRIIADFKIR